MSLISLIREVPPSRGPGAARGAGGGESKLSVHARAELLPMNIITMFRL